MNNRAYQRERFDIMDHDELNREVEKIGNQVEDIRIAQAEYKGRNTSDWGNQREWNKRHESNIDTVFNRLNAVERRVMWISGVMSTIGALIGSVLSKLF